MAQQQHGTVAGRTWTDSEVAFPLNMTLEYTGNKHSLVLSSGRTHGRKVQSSTVLVLSAAFASHFPPSLTVHALLTQHGRLGVLGPQAGGVRRADLLRAGRAAAVVHLGLVDVRQEALVAVLIYTHRHCGVTTTTDE